MGGNLTSIVSKRMLLSGAALCAVAFGAAGVMAAPAAGSNYTESGPQTQLQEVVVTAQKRAQNLQDVPISVTAVTQQSLTVNRIENVKDLTAIAPDLTVHLAAGGTALPEVELRGEISYGTVAGQDKPVGLYLDGAYVGAGEGGLFDLADIERIEVLGGPQGTLFGRNATAGAISFYTHDPVGHWAFHQELTGGTYANFRAKTHIDFPAWGPFSAAVSFLHDQQQGDIKNLGAGTVWHFTYGSFTSPKTLGDKNINTALVAIKFQPTDNFSIIYKFNWTENHGTPEGVGIVNPGLISTFGANVGNPALMTQPSLNRPKQVNDWFSLPNVETVEGNNITAQYRVNDAITIKNIFGEFQEHTQEPGYQLDGAGDLFVAGTIPFVPFGVTSFTDSHNWSDELQLNVNTKWLTFTGGYLHYRFVMITSGPDGEANTQLFQAMPGFMVPLGNSANHHTFSDDTYAFQNSDAGYAQAEFHILPQLDLIAGYRYTHDNKQGRAGVCDNGLPCVFTPYSRGHPAYTIDINYKPVQDVMMYAKYSTSFIAGGALFVSGNVPSFHPYSPEYAHSVEGGIKADWFQHHIRTDLAIFDVYYINEQITGTGTDLIPANTYLGELVVELGNLRDYGFEFNGTVLPFKGATLNVGIGYNEPKATVVVIPLALTPTYKGGWTADVAGHYDTPPIWGPAFLSFNADANYRTGPEVLTGTNPITHLVTIPTFEPGQWILNGRISLTHIPIGPGTGTIAVWGKNILNNKGIDYTDGIAVLTSAEYNPAASFGVDLIFDY